jgi:hypothetical protein
MNAVLFILFFSLATSLGVAADHEKTLSAPRTLRLISALTEDATLSDLEKIVGELGMDVGSAVHSYSYVLDDGSVLHVRAQPSSKRIISITREYAKESTVLFPKLSAKTAKLTEPNQALQRIDCIVTDYAPSSILRANAVYR